MRFIQFKSAPAQNDFPLPPRTITRTSSRALGSVNVSVRSFTNSSLKALWTSGRSRITEAIGFSTLTLSIFISVGPSIPAAPYRACAPRGQPISVHRFAAFWNGHWPVPPRPRLHPEDAEACFCGWSVHSCRNSQSQYHSGVGRIDDPIVPNPRGAVIRIAFFRVFIQSRLHEILLLVRAHFFALRAQLIHLHLK